MCVGAAGTVLITSSFHMAQLVIGRLIQGVGVGFATQATPLYLSEMAPYNLRGALNILFQLAVTIGECVCVWGGGVWKGGQQRGVRLWRTL